jgi:hypothetical protein
VASHLRRKYFSYIRKLVHKAASRPCLYRNLLKKHHGKSPFVTSKYKKENNIKRGVKGKSMKKE